MKLTCAECREFYSKKSRPPPCDTHCKMPGLWEENLPAYQVLGLVGGALFDGWGGVNLTNARLTAEALGYPWDEEMVCKLLAAADVLRPKP